MNRILSINFISLIILSFISIIQIQAAENSDEEIQNLLGKIEGFKSVAKLSPGEQIGIAIVSKTFGMLSGHYLTRSAVIFLGRNIIRPVCENFCDNITCLVAGVVLPLGTILGLGYACNILDIDLNPLGKLIATKTLELIEGKLINRRKKCLLSDRKKDFDTIMDYIFENNKVTELDINKDKLSNLLYLSIALQDKKAINRVIQIIEDQGFEKDLFIRHDPKENCPICLEKKCLGANTEEREEKKVSILL